MTEQPIAHQRMQERLWRCLADPATRQKAYDDFYHTLTTVGMPTGQAHDLVEQILLDLSDRSIPLSAAELRIFSDLSHTTIEAGGESVPLPQVIDSKLTGRAELIYSQIQDHVKDATGDVIDFGCGDGQVTKMIADSLGRQGIRVTGADIRDYRAANAKTFPFSHIKTGATVDADPSAFELAVLTNVLHHEADNEQIMNELDRIVKGKLVIIETVPLGATEKEMQADKDRTFMNDYFYNRLLHDPAIDVPVPGTFETPKGWRDRFAQHGWRVTHEQDLGIDQEVIRDRHHLLVLERDKGESPSR